MSIISAIWTGEIMKIWNTNDVLIILKGDQRRAIQEMLKNEDEAVEGVMPEVCDHPEKIIKYCRNCEMNCRIGKP